MYLLFFSFIIYYMNVIWFKEGYSIYMNIRDNFKKGYVEMLLLKLLSERDLYGYEMTQLIVDRGGGYIKIPEGSLYPTLYKIEDKGYISSYQKQIGKRLKRIYYHLEESGRQYLAQLIKEYYSVNECVTKIIEYENSDNTNMEVKNEKS